MGKQWKQWQTFFFFCSKITVDSDCSHEIIRRLLLGRKAMTNLNSILKNRNITLLTMVHIGKAMVFSNNHVWMWELNHKEVWEPKNWCFWTVVLKQTPESPLYGREIKPVNPKGNQSWIFIGRTDAKLKLQYFGHLFWLIGKDPDAKKNWQQKEKRTAEDEMVR